MNMKNKLVLLTALLSMLITVTSCRPPFGTGDLTRNYDYAPRSADWYLVEDAPILSGNTDHDFTHLSFIDGSTATVPLTTEIIRQQEALEDRELMTFKTPEAQLSYDNNISWIVDTTLHSKTHQAYEHLITKECSHGPTRIFDYAYFKHEGRDDIVDLIFTTYPSEEELSLATEYGVELDIEPVCDESFVFIVNKDNPVDSLTISQIQDIYQGKITNWKQVGGPDAKIIPFQRNANSGSQSAMENIVMEGKPMTSPEMVSESYFSLPDMKELVEAVAKEYDNSTYSIGYTYSYFINSIYRDENIKVIKINGIEPNAQTIKDETYPFFTSYYGVLRKDDTNADPRAKILRDYLLTESGQEYIELAGYYTL